MAERRFIDANALDWVDIEEEYGARTEEVVACEVLIENAPTVDAIPVEFIRRFVTFNPPSAYTSSVHGDEFFDEGSWCNDLLDWWHRENK